MKLQKPKYNIGDVLVVHIYHKVYIFKVEKIGLSIQDNNQWKYYNTDSSYEEREVLSTIEEWNGEIPIDSYK